MGLFRIFNTIVVSATFLAAFSSCADRDADRELDSAERLIWSHPDSALSILETFDTLTLRGNSAKARFSLLHAMALDRNGIDTCDLDVIRPAVRHYERRGSDDDRMRMYYYLGMILYNSKDFRSAIGCFMKAEEVSSGSDDMVFRGLVSSAISDVYAKDYNFVEKIRYAEEACEYFRQAGDSVRLSNTTAWLAGFHADCGHWKTSDSLYTEYLAMPHRDSSMMARHLMNMSLLSLKRPDPEPQKSRELFLEALNVCGGKPSLADYCAYAYASQLVGDRRTTDAILAQIDACGCDSPKVSVWKYRIFKHRGDYKDALDMLEKSVVSQDSVVISALSQSVVQARSDYYETKSALMENERRVQVLTVWIVVLLCLIALSSSVVIYLHCRRKWKRKELAFKSLRREYVLAYKRQYSQLNDLCAEYWKVSGGSRAKDRIYENVRRIVSVVDAGNQKRLERMIDDSLDEMMKKLRRDLPEATDNEFRFMALNILGFDAKTIARIMNYTVQSVYTKRVRLRVRISELASEDREKYLEFID